MSLATLTAIVRRFPQDMQWTMLEFAEAIESNVRSELAARREDSDALQAAIHDLTRVQELTGKSVRELTAAQQRTEQRVNELAEAQKLTEQSVRELTAAQQRTEQRVNELAEAQKLTEQSVRELTEAQKRTEQRLDHLDNVVAELIEAQKRTEQRLDHLDKVVAELIEAQKRTEQRVNELTEAQKLTEQRVNELTEAQKLTEQRVNELAEAQKRTEQRLDELTEAQKRTEESLNRLIQRVDRIEIRLNGLIGDNLERRYRERAFSFLGEILRPVNAFPLQDMLSDLETSLTDKEIDDLAPLDLLLRGRVRQMANRPEVWLAMEISYTVDQGDVKRAIRRTRLLRKAGLRTVAVVAGEHATEGAIELAARQRVFLLQDGRRLNWNEALQWAFSEDEPTPSQDAAEAES